MEKIIGRIEAVAQREGKYGIRVGNDWFNGFGACTLKKGDEVEVEYEVKDSFKNIKSIEKTPFKTADQITPMDGVEAVFATNLSFINDLYTNDERLNKELKEKLDWTKLCITLFMTKMRR